MTDWLFLSIAGSFVERLRHVSFRGTFQNVFGAIHFVQRFDNGVAKKSAHVLFFLYVVGFGSGAC